MCGSTNFACVRMDASALASLSIAAECPTCSLAPLKIAVDEAVVAKVLGCADTLELVLFHCALADLCAACCVSSAFRDAAVAAAGLLLARTPRINRCTLRSGRRRLIALCCLRGETNL